MSHSPTFGRSSANFWSVGTKKKKRKGGEEETKRKGKEKEKKGVKGKTENGKKKEKERPGAHGQSVIGYFQFSALHIIGPFKLKSRRQIDYACDGCIWPYQRSLV